MRTAFASFLSVFLTLFLSISSPAFSQNYYVSNTGSDTHNSGNSPDSPWKTIAKINSLSLQPGDGVYFRRGHVWREQLTVNANGTEMSPIAFGAYSDLPIPSITENSIITATDVYSGWLEYSLLRNTGFVVAAP